MYFVLRDDDTNFFTKPEQLEEGYEDIWRYGPVSLSIVPFHKGCRSKGIPEEFWGTSEIYPLDANENLVRSLRKWIRDGHIEAMLHGYHHEDFSGGPEFRAGKELHRKAVEGKAY